MPTQISTHRLILRRLKAEDLEDLARIVGDYEISKWLVPVPHPYSREDAEAFYDAVQSGVLGVIWAIEFETRFVGVIGVGASFGYWLCPSVWGKGLMSEAAQAVVDVYFRETDAADLRSCYFEGNVGSATVLGRAGFVETDAGTSFSAAQNKEVPSRNMRLTRERWLKRTSSNGSAMA